MCSLYVWSATHSFEYHQKLILKEKSSNFGMCEVGNRIQERKNHADSVENTYCGCVSGYVFERIFFFMFSYFGVFYTFCFAMYPIQICIHKHSMAPRILIICKKFIIIGILRVLFESNRVLIHIPPVPFIHAFLCYRISNRFCPLRY